jgi:poly-gamma-glutamate capsule biosynthesis protein CapA/YwtB (metallophosphatase superfamily)
MNVGLAGIANNHALDFGEEALQDTIEFLHAVGIATAGAGLGRDAARRPAVVSVAGTRVGLLPVTDHPSEYATTTGRWGVAYATM